MGWFSSVSLEEETAFTGLVLRVHRTEIEAVWFNFSWQNGQTKPLSTVSERESHKKSEHDTEMRGKGSDLGSWNPSCPSWEKNQPTWWGKQTRGQRVSQFSTLTWLGRTASTARTNSMGMGRRNSSPRRAVSFGDKNSGNFSQTEGGLDQKQGISPKPVCLSPCISRAAHLPFYNSVRFVVSLTFLLFISSSLFTHIIN